MTFSQNHKSWASNTALGGKIVHEDEFEKMTITEKSYKQRKEDDFSRQETKKLAEKFDIPLEDRYYPALFIIPNVKDTYTYSSFKRDLEESSLEVDKFAVISEGHKNNYIIYSVRTPEQAVKVYRGLSNRRLGGFGQTRVEYIENFPILKNFREYTTQHAIKASLGSFFRHHHHHSRRDSRDFEQRPKYESNNDRSIYEDDYREHKRSGQYSDDRDDGQYKKQYYKPQHNTQKQGYSGEGEHFMRKPRFENKHQYDNKREQNYRASDEYDSLQENRGPSYGDRRGNYNGRNEKRNGKKEYSEKRSYDDNKTQSSKESKIDKATSELIASRKKKANDQKFGFKKKTNKEGEFKVNDDWVNLKD